MRAPQALVVGFSCILSSKQNVALSSNGLFHIKPILASLLSYTVTTDDYMYKLMMCFEVKYIQHYLSKEWICCVVHLSNALVLT